MVVEALGTFFLVWVIVGVAVNPRATKEWAALAIGAALGMGVMVLGPLTGAGFNPARSFGPALVSGEFGGAADFLLVYVLAPVIGALVAGFAYFYLVIDAGQEGRRRRRAGRLADRPRRRPSGSARRQARRGAAGRGACVASARGLSSSAPSCSSRWSTSARCMSSSREAGDQAVAHGLEILG